MPPRLKNIIDDIISIARQDFSIVKLYLFGSYARGEATVFSDVDIAVIHESTDVNRGALNEAVARL